MSKQGSERLRSRTEIQVGEEELQNQRTRFRTVKKSLEEQQHRAGTTLKCVCAESKLKRCMERMSAIPDEVKSQKQKQSPYQKSMVQTLNAKRWTRTTKLSNTTLRSTNSGHGQGGDPELTMTIRKSVIINEYESDKINPSDTILTMTPLESSRKEM